LAARPPAQPPRQNIAADELAAYDHILERTDRLRMPGAGDGLAGPYWGALLNAPSLAYGLAEMGRLVRTGELRGSYSHAQRELVDVVMSADFGYNAILALHIPDALAVGVRIEAIDAIRANRNDELTDEERAIATYTRAVIGGHCDDALFQIMAGRLGLRGAVEFTVFITFLIGTMRLWQALGIPEPSSESIDKMLDGYRDGATPLPDPSMRIG
jgi:alkylhydroperoxidase family enzyme